MAKKKRYIDNDLVQKKVSDLFMLQLDLLLERVQDGTVEPQELRIIWDIVRHNKIGVEGVDEMVEKAIEERAKQIQDIEIDDDWSFNTPHR